MKKKIEGLKKISVHDGRKFQYRFQDGARVPVSQNRYCYVVMRSRECSPFIISPFQKKKKMVL